MKHTHRTVVTPLQDEITARIAGVVRRSRERKGLSVVRFAELAGVSASVINTLERGGGNPQLSILFAIAAAVGKPLDKLLAPPRKAPAGSGIWHEHDRKSAGRK